MSNLKEVVRREAAKADPSAYVVLFELKETNVSPGATPAIIRFTSSVYTDRAITFGGNIYMAIPVEAEGFELRSAGTLPTPVLRVGLSKNPIGNALRSVDDFIGWELKRIRTLAIFLDGADGADSTATLPVDTYRVEKKVGQSLETIEWELQAAIDQEGVMLPKRQVIRDFCTHRYRVWDPVAMVYNYKNVTCPFAGANAYDEQNNLTSDKSNDVCGRTVRSCATRFGRGISLPTTAFPGAGQ